MGLARRPNPVIILASVVLLFVAAAIGFDALVSSRTPGHESEYSVVVRQDGEELADFTLDDLQKIDMTEITVDGETDEGPRLLAVLEEAGVKDFESVHVAGMGVRDDGVIDLTRTDITDQVILDITRRGTVKIVSPTMAWGDRVRDVVSIEVR